jgi:hypothetical protein
MLKLFVTILMLSDTGAVSTSLQVTDMNDAVACGNMERQINTNKPSVTTYNGRSAQIMMQAKCATDGPADPGVVAGRQGAKPVGPAVNDFVGDMFSRFGRSLQER